MGPVTALLFWGDDEPSDFFQLKCDMKMAVIFIGDTVKSTTDGVLCDLPLLIAGEANFCYMLVKTI